MEIELYTDVTNCTCLVDALAIDSVKAAFHIIETDNVKFPGHFSIIAHAEREDQNFMT